MAYFRTPLRRGQSGECSSFERGTINQKINKNRKNEILAKIQNFDCFVFSEIFRANLILFIFIETP